MGYDIGMLRRLWKWISQERNRRTLAWLGGAVVVIAGAAWKVYTYEPPLRPTAAAPVQPVSSQPPARESGTAPPAPVAAAAADPDSVRTQSAAAHDGGIAINADGDARVTVQQSRP